MNWKAKRSSCFPWRCCDTARGRRDTLKRLSWSTNVAIRSRTHHKPAANTFVLGVDIGGDAVGFYFGSIAKASVVNHRVSEHELVAWADWKSREGHIFLRKAQPLRDNAREAPESLTFSASEVDRRIADNQTGSLWDVETGVAVSGPLAGNVLQRVPFISSFDWAWKDFYPDSEFFGDLEDRGP